MRHINQRSSVSINGMNKRALSSSAWNSNDMSNNDMSNNDMSSNGMNNSDMIRGTTHGMIRDTILVMNSDIITKSKPMYLQWSLTGRPTALYPLQLQAIPPASLQAIITDLPFLHHISLVVQDMVLRHIQNQLQLLHPHMLSQQPLLHQDRLHRRGTKHRSQVYLQNHYLYTL
jgi:hypothetical protein